MLDLWVATIKLSGNLKSLKEHKPHHRLGLKIKIEKMEIGKKIWVIAEGYLPSWNYGPPVTGYESACILNATDTDAHLEIMIYFSNKEPTGPYKITIPARRTKHLRYNDLKYPKPIPGDTEYSSVIISDVPVIVQHSKLDSQAENALHSTIAYAE